MSKGGLTQQEMGTNSNIIFTMCAFGIYECLKLFMNLLSMWGDTFYLVIKCLLFLQQTINSLEHQWLG